MGRIRKQFVRDGFTRKVQRLFIIATEGTKTERQYFEELKSSSICKDFCVYIETLKRSSTAGSPKHVLDEMKSFKREYIKFENDELWIVIDRDKQAWEVGAIAFVARECRQSNIGFALSNPSFELWLLLHLTSFDHYTNDELMLMLQNRKVNGITYLESKLAELLGKNYKKNNIQPEYFMPYCVIAADRAQLLDGSTQGRWPIGLGTRVYLLLNRIMGK